MHSDDRRDIWQVDRLALNTWPHFHWAKCGGEKCVLYTGEWKAGNVNCERIFYRLWGVLSRGSSIHVTRQKYMLRDVLSRISRESMQSG